MALLIRNPARAAALFAAIACAAWCALAPTAVAGGETGGFQEYEIKAGYLVNFPKYIDWPEDAFPDPEAPFKFGILGENPFGDVLGELLRGLELHGRPAVLVSSDDPADLHDCHVVYTALAMDAGAADAIDALRDSRALTVGEQEGFAERGGMINFVRQDAKVKFEVNLKSANRASLNLSARLLRLAVKVFR